MIGASSLTRPPEADTTLYPLWREACSHVYAVRRAFNLTPTDPRWLAMDEQQVIDEAVLLRFHDLHQARLASPSVHAATEPGVADDIMRELEALKANPAELAALAATSRALRSKSAGGEKAVTRRDRLKRRGDDGPGR